MAGPPSPPVPILHSPTRVISVEDQKNWKIPPCVSNWKNNKGYTIPLHQRLANSGRGLKNTTINDRFASFSEALFYAERNARRMINERARIKVSNLANREIETPAADKGTPGLNTPGIGTPGIGTPSIGTPGVGRTPQMGTPSVRGGDTPGFTSDDIRAKDERDRLRKEALRRRKRERNLAKAKGAGVRPSRDISEQIALGENVNVRQGGEAMFDQRLFNRSQGLDSGFGADDDYNLYDKPLMSQVNKRLYRPKKLEDDTEDQSEIDKMLKEAPKFAAHKNFEGAKEAKPSDGPVQFEKHVGDVFGLEDVEAKPSKPKRRERERERRRSKEREKPRERRRDRDRSRERDRRRKKRKRSNSPSPTRERRRRKKEKKRRRE